MFKNGEVYILAFVYTVWILMCAYTVRIRYDVSGIYKCCWVTFEVLCMVSQFFLLNFKQRKWKTTNQKQNLIFATEHLLQNNCLHELYSFVWHVCWFTDSLTNSKFGDAIGFTVVFYLLVELLSRSRGFDFSWFFVSDWWIVDGFLFMVFLLLIGCGHVLWLNSDFLWFFKNRYVGVSLCSLFAVSWLLGIPSLVAPSWLHDFHDFLHLTLFFGLMLGLVPGLKPRLLSVGLMFLKSSRLPPITFPNKLVFLPSLFRVSSFTFSSIFP